MKIEDLNKRDLDTIKRFTRIIEKVSELDRLRAKLVNWVIDDCKRARVDIEHCIDFYIANNE